MTSSLDALMAESVESYMVSLYLAREETCRTAWALTHPDYRHRLTLFERDCPGTFTREWSIGCWVP